MVMIIKLKVMLYCINLVFFLVLGHTENTLALKPSHWLNLKTKGHSIKLSYLGLTQRLASLDNQNNLYVYDWSKTDLKTLK